MVQTLWLVAEEGMDRVLVSTAEPTHYLRARKESGKANRVFQVQVELPDVEQCDGVIHVKGG